MTVPKSATSFRLPDELLERMRAQAARWGITITDIVRAGIEVELARLELMPTPQEERAR